MSFAKEAWAFVLPVVAAALALFYFERRTTAIVVAVLAILVLLFFRDPARRSTAPASAVLAAADGLITSIDAVEDPEIGPGKYVRIVTFLSVFDVHVQHCPVDGEIVFSALLRGKKLAAFRADVGDKNERYTNVFLRSNGDHVGVRQLAGLIARRVVSYLHKGDRRTRGELMGVIKFGSRVDLYVPARYEIRVSKGERVRGGETVMADDRSAAGAGPAAGSR
ncbi:MAG: phosphatidylserine decarboxylase [Thermoanaerobaculia bacterium]